VKEKDPKGTERRITEWLNMRYLDMVPYRGGGLYSEEELKKRRERKYGK